jgi:hypothetical protein
VKRRDLVRELTPARGVLYRHSSSQDIALTPATRQKQPVLRHADVDDALAQHMKKYLGLKALTPE